jgi:hypothetical protein
MNNVISNVAFINVFISIDIMYPFQSKPHAIKNFLRFKFMNVRNKPECLPLTGLSSLV